MKPQLILKNILLITLLLILNGCLSGDSKKTDTNKNTQTEQKDKDKPKLPKDDNSSTNDTKTNKENNNVSEGEDNSKNKGTNKETLTLLPPSTQPLKNESLTLHVKDKKGNFITKNITWLTTPKNTIKENGTNIITPIKDTDITLQAKYNDTLSNKIILHVKWIVNNYELPPEPDPKINNSTLLGIDVNNNDVRDDVERWIYETYKHPIERGIFMQNARYYQKVIVDPKKAHETKKKYSDPISSCMGYWKYEAKENNESFALDHFRNYYKEIRPIQLNTAKRYIAYDRYLRALSGSVWSVKDGKKSDCEFDSNGNLR